MTSEIGSVKENMKSSIYNIVLEDGDSLLLFNSMVGLDSLCRVSEEYNHIVNYKIIEQITDLFEKNQEYECEIIMDVLGAL